MQASTGEFMWTQTKWDGSMIHAGGRWIILRLDGTLAVVVIQDDKVKVLASRKILGGACRTAPVLSSAWIYGRNTAGDLVGLDVSGFTSKSNTIDE